MRRALRILAGTIVLFALVAGAIAWLAVQPATLAWLLAQGAGAAGGRLETEDLRGSLVAPITARRVLYEDAGLRVEVADLELRIASLADLFLHRSLRVERLAASAVDVVTKTTSDAPARPPASLALPIDVDAPVIELGRVSVTPAGGAPVRLGDLRAAYLYARAEARHRVELANVVTDYGRARGEAAIGADAPFPLTAQLALDQPGTDFPYRVTASAGGDLSRIGVGFEATVEFGAAAGALVLQPFEGALVDRIVATARDIDPKRVDRKLPAARLSVDVSGGIDAEGRFSGRVAVANALAGPVDRDRIPLVSLAGDLSGDAELARLANLVARTRSSVVTGSAAFSRRTLSLDLRTTALDVGDLHSSVRSTRLAGEVSARIAPERQSARGTLGQRDLALDFDLAHEGERVDVRAFELRAGAGVARGRGGVRLAGGHPFEIAASVEGFDPAALGRFPQASLTGEFTASGTLDAPRRIDGRFRLARGTFRGHPVEGEGRVAVAGDRVTDANVAFVLARNRIEASGAFGAPGDTLRWSLVAPDPGALLSGVGGRATAEGTLTGAWDRPIVDFAIDGDALRVDGVARVARLVASGRYADAAIDMKASASGIDADGIAGASVDATLAGTRDAHRLVVAARTRSPDVQLDAALAGALADDLTWRGAVERLESRGRYPVRLVAPAQARLGTQGIRIGAAELAVAGGVVRIARFERESGTVSTEGTAAGLVLGRLLDMAGLEDVGAGDLRLQGAWRVLAGPRLDADIRVARESGDVRLPREIAAGRPAADRFVGLTQAEASLRAVNEKLDLRVALAGRRAGVIRAALAAPLARDGAGWRVPPDGRLAGEAVFEGGELASLRPFLPEEIRLRGSADGTLTIGGTVAAPRLDGVLRLERVVFAIPEQGVRLGEGRAALHFTERGVRLEDARFAGERGTLTATGALDWEGAQPSGAVRIVLRGLDAFTDPIIRVVVSGEVDARIRGRAVAVTGSLRADEGTIRLPDHDMPTVSDDVVVRGRGRPPSAEPRRDRDADAPTLPDVDLALSLGERFAVKGRGVDAKLAGDLRLRMSDRGVIRLTGTVTTKDGTVTAYGQTLKIETGTLTFSGPIDNPALNITAVRPNIPSRVGVTITGFAQAPRASLFSDVAMTNTERLSWLILGRSPETASPTDLALLGAAVAGAALGGPGATPITSQIASKFGLDEVAVKTMQGAQNAVVAVGKRLSDRLYVSFEQSLGGIGYAIRLRYVLSRNWSIQTQAGLDNTVDLLFTKRFD